jgi:hypothetical protein
MVVNRSSKSSTFLMCESCHYNTSRQSQYDRHLMTLKHKMIVNGSSKSSKSSKGLWKCDCGKEYKYDSGFYRHKKTCNHNKQLVNEDYVEKCEETRDELKELKNLVVEVMKSNNELLKQNIELQEQVINVCKNMKQPSITNTHTNSHNKTFNLQFFLNEQCKDAMNISDFINSVTLNIKDLERVGSLGYVEGISTIIINELRNIDIYKRPMHCSDSKRETLYIKDENKWEKEDGENKKIKNVIKSVEHKNLKMINEWTKEHPLYKASDDKDNDKYLNIILEATGGGGGGYEDKGNKIIKKIAKEIAIDKQ